MQYNRRMQELYKKNYTINPIQKARRFNNPFLIASSQTLLSNILKAQTNPPSLQQTANKMAETASNIETSKQSSVVESEKIKTAKKAKIVSDKAKADKVLSDAKKVKDAKAKEIQDKFNKSVADQLKRDKAKDKKTKDKSESGGIKISEGKKPTVPPKKKIPDATPTPPPVKPVPPKITVPKEGKAVVAKETDSAATLNKIKNNMSLPELNRKRAGYIIEKNEAKSSLKLLNNMNDPISNPPPYQPFLTASGERQVPGSEMEKESDAYRIWFKQYGKLWLKREAAKQTFREKIQKEDALLKGNSQSLVEKSSSANNSRYFPNKSETHIPVVKNEISRLKRVVGETPGNLPARLALQEAQSVLVKLNKEKSSTAKLYVKAVKDRNNYAVKNGVNTAEFKVKSKLVETLIDKLHSYDKLSPSHSKAGRDHKLPDPNGKDANTPFGNKEGSKSTIGEAAGASSLRGGGN